LDIRRLQWTKDEYRLRIWKYRFLYKVYESRIYIYFYDADSRGDIYK
jgi:mRNA interferase RelE/StbE